VSKVSSTDRGLRIAGTGSSGAENAHLQLNAQSSEIRLATGLTDRLVINSTGNVGIASSSPGTKLGVEGRIVANDIVVSSLLATSTATSTFAGGLQANALNVTATNATSTFANGIRFTGGNLQVDNFADCTVKTDGAGAFFCGTDDDGSGSTEFGQAWELTTVGGTQYLAPTTTITILANNGFVSQASSTVVGQFAVTGNMGVASSTPWGKLSVENTGAGHSFIVADEANDLSPFVIDASGNVGIGTTTPWRTLSVSGTVGFDGLTGATGAGSLCLDANLQVVYNDGSDACLSSTRDTKHDISALTLDALGVLQDLEPASFVYNDSEGRVRYGFIAEDAELVDSSLATYNASGTISGIDDRAILSVVVKALQEVANIAGAFKDKLLAWFADAGNGIGDFFARRVRTQELCVGETCVTESTLRKLLELKADALEAGSPEDDTSSSKAQDTEPPIITIIGNNPARIPVGAAYVDLGATVTDNANKNLGVHAFVGSTTIELAHIDTSEPTTYHITYRATDEAGNTAETVREVEVYDPTQEGGETEQPTTSAWTQRAKPLPPAGTATTTTATATTTAPTTELSTSETEEVETPASAAEASPAPEPVKAEPAPGKRSQGEVGNEGEEISRARRDQVDVH
jgi:hypothetical protein